MKQDRNNRESRFDHHSVLRHLAVSIYPSSIPGGPLPLDFYYRPRTLPARGGSWRVGEPPEDSIRIFRLTPADPLFARDNGGRLDQSKFEILLRPVDQMIAKSEPRQAEYWRGYREGIRFRFQDNTWASYRDHYHLHEIADRIDDDSPAVAYARGYCDGCMGKMPEDSP